MIKDFPVKCNTCKDLIQDGDIFYKHPDLGFVCEYCPEFNEGHIERKEIAVREPGTKSIYAPFGIPREQKD